MRAFIQNTITFLFRKSWTTLLMALILGVLFYFTYSGWIIFLSVLYFITAAIFHLIGKRWIGLLASIVSLIFSAFLLLIWGIELVLSEGPSGVGKHHSSYYENKENIESIIGISLPEFTIDNSEITHMSQFDFEVTSEAVLKFKTLPSDKTFQYLDSICKLEVPDSVDASSKIFVPGLESYYNPWSKEKNEYQFSIIGDPLKKYLHKEDAFFTLTLEKNSQYARVRYGNY